MKNVKLFYRYIRSYSTQETVRLGHKNQLCGEPRKMNKLISFTKAFTSESMSELNQGIKKKLIYGILK